MADHRRDVEYLVRRFAQLRQAARDHLLDALGNGDLAQRALLERGQAAQRLLDEERVPVGLLGQPAQEARGHVVAGDERARLFLGQPRQDDVLERPLPAQAAEQLTFERPRGADDQQSHRRAVLEQVAEQQQRRRVGPVQIVEQQHDRALARGEREHPVDALEQPEAACLGLVAERLAELRHVAAQLRDEARELGQLARDLARQDQRLAVGDEVRQRGDERLVREERLRVRAPIEDRRVGTPRELGREPGLADPGVARQQDELALAADRDAEPRRQPLEQLLAAHERSTAGLDRERRRERDGGGDARRRVPLGDAALGRRHRDPADRRPRRAAEVARRRIAVVRVLGHRAPHHLAQQFGRVRQHAQHRRRRRVEVREHRRRGRLARVGHLAGDRLVEHGAERVDVRAGIHRRLPQLLGGGVVERSDHAARMRDLRLRPQVLHQPEVGQQRVLALQQDVRRFDVAVHDPGAVRGVERLRDLGDDRRRHVRFQPSPDVQQPREVGALDEAHRHVEQPVLLAGVVDRHDVRVLDRRRGAELALEAAAELLVLGELGRDHLQRHLAIERDVARAIDDSHPAAARDVLDHVVGERRPGLELRHSRSSVRRPPASATG